MSSRFIPPKVGSRYLTVLIISSGSVALISISNASIPANLLKSTLFPSMTGFDARAPILPRPSTAVPFDTIPTRFPLFVYSYTSLGFLCISRQGSATPGE